MKKLLILIILLLPGVLAFCQNTITGKVVDKQNSPLPGVNVNVKGTTTGTITNLQGDYSITAGEDDILVFSYIGFTKVERKVENNKQINLTLLEDVKRLDEVVVIGYGTMKRSDLTGSVSSVSSEDIHNAEYMSIDQTLAGRAAGVQVIQTNAEPGGNVKIRIRGSNSINGNNEPLFVVDGFPLPPGAEAFGSGWSSTGNTLGGLHPEDIESIEILKDASATAIYGARASNGVVLITTKRGKVGNVKVNFKTKVGITGIPEPYDMMNGQEYATMVNLVREEDGDPPLYDGSGELFRTPEEIGEGTDWVEKILRTGVRQDHNLSISGGTSDLNYMISGNFTQDEGVILGSDFQRGTVRANIGGKTEKFSYSLSSLFSRVRNERSITNSGAFPDAAGPIYYAQTANPTIPFILEDGSYPLEDPNFGWFNNPYLIATEKTDITSNDEYMADLDLNYEVVDGLKINLVGGARHFHSKREVYYPSYLARGATSNGEGIYNNLTSRFYRVGAFLRYEKTYGIHGISALAGYENQEYVTERLGATYRDFAFDNLGIYSWGAANDRAAGSSTRVDSKILSTIVRLNYTLKDRYMFTASGRRDGSSKFAENNKYGFFPSAAFAWRASQEDFIEDLNLFCNLKFRASYGETGSEAISAYQSLAVYTKVIYGSGGTINSGVRPASLGNPDLKWETTKQSNIGVDMGFFNNRLTANIDLYKKVTEDLLMPKQLPSTTGFLSAMTNIGSIQNKGVELQIFFDIVRTDNFNWAGSFNISHNKSEVLDLGESEFIYGPALGLNYPKGVGHIVIPGEEYGLFYGWEMDGLLRPEDFDGDPEDGITNVAVPSDTWRPGYWKFKDQITVDTDGDGVPDATDGVINDDDRVIIGNANPDFIWGLNQDFTYKNWSLNVFIQGSQGNDILNITSQALNSGYGNQTIDYYNNRWTYDNQHNNPDYPRYGNPWQWQVANTNAIEDGSYIRLKNISLRYSFSIGDYMDAQVFATGTNLLTITGYSGYDPEVNSFGSNDLAPGVDFSAYPVYKIYTFGLNLTF